MKDQRGIYYFPEPGNAKVRVYVRKTDQGIVEFRLWEVEHPEVWEKHGWIPMDVIQKAAAMYAQSGRGSTGADPTRLYDMTVACALLGEEGK